MILIGYIENVVVIFWPLFWTLRSTRKSDLVLCFINVDRLQDIHRLFVVANEFLKETCCFTFQAKELML